MEGGREMFLQKQSVGSMTRICLASCKRLLQFVIPPLVRVCGVGREGNLFHAGEKEIVFPTSPRLLMESSAA
jgi:hypothetical protein